MSTQRMIAAVALGLSLGAAGYAKADYNLTTLDFPDSILTIAAGINDAGLIVGKYDDTGRTRHGFRYDPSVGVDSYATLDVPDSTLTGADAINDSGLIGGRYRDAGSTSHGSVSAPT